MKDEIAALEAAMERQGYIADRAITTALFLAKEMRRPLLIEGDAGVGKTEIAKVLARLLDTELIYEPTARAMAAALPYVDRLLPAHNLESLERLLPLLTA